jgi:glutamyl/glutaminyl-tRNA synthetase
MSGNEVINFDALESEAAMPERLAKSLKFLEKKLAPADYAIFLEELGIGKDLTNKELFDKVCSKLDEFSKKMFPEETAPEEKPGEAPPVEKKEEIPPKKEEELAAESSPEFKAFMEQCMKGGKDQKSCAEEWKTQYPSPPTGPAKDKEASELAKKVEELEKKCIALEAEKKLAEVKSEVESLVQAKHLAPAQREAVVKLSSQLEPTLRADFLNVFKGQKLTPNVDAGQAKSEAPGATGTMTPERRKELMAKFGIDELILDKAVKVRRNN